MLIIQTKGAIMKTTLIRTLTIAVLATSLSAFAETGAKKSDDAAACNTTQQSKSKQKANDSGKQDKSKESQEQQDQDRLLLGIYG
jgi:hypothetical protein